MVPACKKKKFNTSHRRNEITDIEGRQQKHDSWYGKPPVEGSLELGPLPTLHGVSYSLSHRTLSHTILACRDQIIQSHDKLFVDLLKGIRNIPR